MSIEQAQQKTYPLWFKPSHRTWPEQAVGAAIFLFVSLTAIWLSGWQLSLQNEWAENIVATHWSFLGATSESVWTLYHLLFAFAIWLLWRRYSLTTLKLEVAVFLFQLVLQAGWVLLFFSFREALLALTALLFLCSTTLLAALLFWKKDRFSGQALILPFFWILYVMGVNMAICISNP